MPKNGKSRDAGSRNVSREERELEKNGKLKGAQAQALAGRLEQSSPEDFGKGVYADPVLWQKAENHLRNQTGQPTGQK